jgi:RHS repeat-associated protein
VGGTATYFVYDEAGHLLGEYGGGGALIQETVWLGDVPLATLRPKEGGGVEIFYVHTDHLNAPRKITRASDGALMWRWDPAPFGDTLPNENPEAAGSFRYNLRYPGQYYDAESGLSYNYFRNYDPFTGRYVESDPIGLAAGVNTYAYVNGHPLSLSDMLGLCASPQNDEKKKEECEQKLADLLNLIQAVRGDRRSEFKGLAQRYRQLRGYTGETLKRHVDEFKNRQKNLQRKMKDYTDSGCGDPPALVIEWANKEVPEPVNVPETDSPSGQQGNNQSAVVAALLILLRILPAFAL